MPKPARFRRSVLVSHIVAGSLIAAQALAAPAAGPQATVSANPKIEPCRGDIYESNRPQGRDDPFYPAAHLHSGKYAGRCMDTSYQRSLRLLTPQEARPFGPRAGYTMVGNFSYNGRFWVAKIPPHAVGEVIVQQDHFGMQGTEAKPEKGIPAAHTELRFRMLKPVILVPQVRSMIASYSLPPHRRYVELHDIVSSDQVLGIRGAAFGTLAGIDGELAIAYTLVALEDKAKYFFKQNQRVEQFRLTLTDAEKQKLLGDVIKIGQARQLDLTYDMFHRSCTTELLRTLDYSLAGQPNFTRPPLPFRLANDWNPNFIYQNLRIRGIAGPDEISVLPNLEIELRDLMLQVQEEQRRAEANPAPGAKR